MGRLDWCFLFSLLSIMASITPSHRELYLPSVPTLSAGSEMHAYSGLTSSQAAPMATTSLPSATDATGKSKSHPAGPSSVPVRFSSSSSSAATVLVGNGPKTAAFSPYSLNGGTVMALAGKDYCVVAADTRMSQGYEILTRSASKAVFAAGGMSADRTAFQRMLKFELAQYEAKMGREMSTQALAQLVSTRPTTAGSFPTMPLSSW